MSLLLLYRPRGADAVVVGGAVRDDGDAIAPRPQRKGVLLNLVPLDEDAKKQTKSAGMKRAFVFPDKVKTEAFGIFAEDKAEKILEKLSRDIVDKFAKDDLENQILVKTSAIFKMWIEVKKQEIVLLMFTMGGFDE